ncbi:MAG: hypothetical protein AB1481_04100, partial [Candidatus Omnitrophota bacterium]
MELFASINKYKNLILNILFLILALLIANNIYKKQVREIGKIRSQKENEIKKAEVLKEIVGLDKKLGAYRSLFTIRDSSEVVANINALAGEYDININSIRPEPEQRMARFI